ncbi:uncharacterized protein [Choristoneura fumiferana]|uniref:uncharacterized protein n=1 Tax=Choristoneura fumiferana TaxID=7141 RepID=UPI003D15F066
MKGYLLVFAVFLAIIAATVASPAFNEGDDSGQLLERFRRSEKCDFNACDRLCRRLKFPGGACIGDKCDCDNF